VEQLRLAPRQSRDHDARHLANIRIKNQMLDGEEGGDTVYIPTMQKMAIWDAAEKYRATARR
jgi:aconitase A